MILQVCSPMPRYWMSRLILCWEVFVVVVLSSWGDDASRTAKAIDATGAYGWTLIIALFFVCLIGIADVIVNDVLPPRFSFVSAMHWRHLNLMAMALILAALGVLVVYAIGFTTLLFVYWLNASLAAWLTFLDIFDRHGA